MNACCATFKPISKIYIFGPSCSGKSTLSQALLNRLGKEKATYLDRDEMAEELSLDEVEKKIQEIATVVIFDTQIPWRPKKEDEFYVRLRPSRETLLHRDGIRTKNLNRDVDRAKRALQFVEKTHTISGALPDAQFDLTLDSSLLSVAQEVEAIYERIQSLNQ